MIDESVRPVLVAVQTATGVAWVFGSALRVHLMDRSSALRVRLAMSVFAGGGLFFAVAPWVWAPYHELFETLSGLAVVSSLWVKAAFWRRDVEFGGGRGLRSPPA